MSIGETGELIGTIGLITSGTENIRLRSECRSIWRQDLHVLDSYGQRFALDQFASWWRSVPALVNVTGQHGTTQHLIPFVALVDDGAQVADGAINQVVGALRNGSRQSTLDELADGRELIVETSVQAGSGGRSHEQMTLVTSIVDNGTNVKAVGSDHGGVWWLLRTTTGLGFCGGEG